MADRQDDCLPLTHVVEELRKLLKLQGTLAAQPAVPSNPEDLNTSYIIHHHPTGFDPDCLQNIAESDASWSLPSEQRPNQMGSKSIVTKNIWKHLESNLEYSEI